MDQRQDLIRKICENPACDTARLIYADWLDEFGDEDDALDAEQIRLQIHFQELNISLPWSHPSIPAIKGQVRRGMVERLFISVEVFMEKATNLFSEHPITAVKFDNKQPATIGLTDHPSILVGCFWQFVQGAVLPPQQSLRSALPMELMPGVRGHQLCDGAGRFATIEHALQAASDAAVDFGRALESVRLPLLVRTLKF